MSKNFVEKNERLKSLVIKNNESGKKAWEVGKILFSIYEQEEYKNNYATFSDYTRMELGMSSRIALQYIEIFEKIPEDQINENTPVSYLYILLDMNDRDRLKFLSSINKLYEKIKNKNLYLFGGHRRLFSQSLDSAKNMIFSSNQELLEEDIDNILEELLKKQNDEIQRKRFIKYTMGEEINTTYFPYLSASYAREPVDEQGLVGLFCTMFPCLKEHQFTVHNRQIIFSRIIYTRNAFPDAQIEVIVLEKNGKKFTTLDIEFEFNSFNYILHKHHQSYKTCEMIICWENNWKNDKITKPPILSVKKLIDSGTIQIEY
jgi:hypothetical protein